MFPGNLLNFPSYLSISRCQRSTQGQVGLVFGFATSLPDSLGKASLRHKLKHHADAETISDNVSRQTTLCIYLCVPGNNSSRSVFIRIWSVYRSCRLRKNAAGHNSAHESVQTLSRRAEPPPGRL